MKGFIYLIESLKTNGRYLGCAEDPSRRIKEHNSGTVDATKYELPWRCLLIINVGDVTEARKIEYYIKRQKRKLTIKNIIKTLNRYFENEGM